VHLGAGRATLSTANLQLGDFTSIPNSLSNGAIVPVIDAAISFTVNWFDAHDHRIVNNPAPDFRVEGMFVDTSASIVATASNANGFSFTTDSAGQTAVTAKIGHERNGVFFDH
jgi:hypothetical protein